MRKIEIKASFNPHKQVIGIDGDGQATIKFTTSATELAKVLTAFVNYTNNIVLLTIEKSLQNLNKYEIPKTKNKIRRKSTDT